MKIVNFFISPIFFEKYLEVSVKKCNFAAA